MEDLQEEYRPLIHRHIILVKQVLAKQPDPILRSADMIQLLRHGRHGLSAYATANVCISLLLSK